MRNSANTDDELWALTGYHGATVAQATKLSSSWQGLDVVLVQDMSGDGVADLVYRSDALGRLMLRKGTAASGGGVSLTSLGSSTASSGGADTTWSGTGWVSTNMLFVMGTPDANGDGVPDVWGVTADGSVRFYAGSRTAPFAGGIQVIDPTTWWRTRTSVG